MIILSVDVIFLIIGAILGQLLAYISHKRRTIQGTIVVDHNNNQFRVMVNSTELLNPNSKYIKFKIDHNATISREEQVL